MKTSAPSLPRSPAGSASTLSHMVGSSGDQPPFWSHLGATGSHLMNINSGVSQGAHALQRYPHSGNILGLLHVPLMFIILHGLLLGNVQTENREWMRARCGWSYRSGLMEKSWPHRHRLRASTPSAPVCSSHGPLASECSSTRVASAVSTPELS